MAASAVTPFVGPILDLAVTGSIGNNMFWRWVFWFQAIFVRLCISIIAKLWFLFSGKEAGVC